MTDERAEEIQHYKQLVDAYHALDEKIDALLTRYGGHTENMPAEAMEAYRQLARERDDVFNEMRMMEQSLLSDQQGD